MYINCFTEETRSFSSKEAWAEFDLLLTQKLGREHVFYTKTIAGMDHLRSEYFWDKYECRTCGQKWELFKPFVNNAGTVYTGYFVRQKASFWQKLRTLNIFPGSITAL
ncbi:hypothetical protein GCM10027422_36740 [Hymenobacter arcticus]